MPHMRPAASTPLAPSAGPADFSPRPAGAARRLSERAGGSPATTGGAIHWNPRFRVPFAPNILLSLSLSLCGLFYGSHPNPYTTSTLGSERAHLRLVWALVLVGWDVIMRGAVVWKSTILGIAASLKERVKQHYSFDLPSATRQSSLGFRCNA